MRKKIICMMSLMLLCIVGIVFIPSDNRNPHIEVEDGNIVLVVPSEEGEVRIVPWLDEEKEIYYFFLPSFVKNSQITTGLLEKPLNWKKDEVYNIEISDEGQSRAYNLSFLKASTISSIFIQTKSGDMEAIHADKEYQETGTISVISANGNIEYEGDLERISGRGNTSWEYSKKPYSIKLKESRELCGLQKGKKWNLLPIWREGNKMNTKVLFDIAAAAGLNYTPECTWVDLYLNNEYVGIYLLSESISVSGGRVEIYDLEDENETLNPQMEKVSSFEEKTVKGYELEKNPENITGGYLIEKDLDAYYEMEKAGFITDAGMTFSIAAPQHASREQVYYVQDYIQNIENLLEKKDEEVKKYIDVDSFSRKYLVDEISLNFDTNITSMYFYKEKDNNLLYAGPVWDYDSALGECNAGYAEGWYVDYTNSILNKGSEFNWYLDLYEYEWFEDSVINQYKRLLPYLEEVLNQTIDLYANAIKDSVAMDSVRWKNEDVDRPGNYVDFENNVRYLKYFLSARINWLNDKLGISNYVFRWNGNGSTHEVILLCDGNIIQKMTVIDGEIIEKLPELNPEIYLGWYFEYNDEKHREQIPILEDTVIYARKRKP